MKGKFVTNVSLATVRLINDSWDRLSVWQAVLSKIYLSLPSQYLKRKLSYFFFKLNHKTDMNINE
jgi:hypothetical protein